MERTSYLLGGKKGMARKEKVPKGYVPMIVGGGRETEKILVHTKLFKHPCFAVLLEMAAQEFGYKQQGILQIPCGVKEFRSVIKAVEKEKAKS